MKNLMRLLLVAAALLTVSAAHARSPEWCIEGLETGDETLLRNNVDRLLNESAVYNDAEIEMATRCLKAHKGFDYVYDPETGRFFTANQFAFEQGRRAAEAAKKKRDEAAAKEAAERARQAAEVDAIVAKAKADREFSVAQRLRKGCENMYRRDPDATITNQMCFDLFWRYGLPD